MSCMAEVGLSMGIQRNGVAEESSDNASVVEVRESFLVLMGQVVVSLVTISTSNGSHHPSPNGKILWDFAAGNCIICCISLFTRVLICGRQRGFASCHPNCDCDLICWHIFWVHSLRGHVAAR